MKLLLSFFGLTLVLTGCASFSGVENAKNIAKLKHGQSESEVLSLLGTPDSIVHPSATQDQWIYEFKKQDKYTFNEFKDIFILGFKAYQELVKDKLFTIEDIDNAYIQGKNDESISGNKKKMREEYLQSLLPKTEWDVEFDEQGKLKLV